MTRTVRQFATLITLAIAATACADSAASPLEPLALKGGSSGGSKGKDVVTVPPAPTPVYAVIDRVSAAATCSAGSSYSVTLRSGANNRIEVIVSAIAAAEPTGPAVFPSLFPQTSLGGYIKFRIADEAQGIVASNTANNVGLATLSYTNTSLGRGVQPGTYNFTFTATNYQQDGVLDYIYLQTLPPHEICTATLTTTAR